MLLYFPGVHVLSRKVGAIPLERANRSLVLRRVGRSVSGGHALGGTATGSLLKSELRVIIAMS